MTGRVNPNQHLNQQLREELIEIIFAMRNETIAALKKLDETTNIEFKSTADSMHAFTKNASQMSPDDIVNTASKIKMERAIAVKRKEAVQSVLENLMKSIDVQYNNIKSDDNKNGISSQQYNVRIDSLKWFRNKVFTLCGDNDYLKKIMHENLITVPVNLIERVLNISQNRLTEMLDSIDDRIAELKELKATLPEQINKVPKNQMKERMKLNAEFKSCNNEMIDSGSLEKELSQYQAHIEAVIAIMKKASIHNMNAEDTTKLTAAIHQLKQSEKIIKGICERFISDDVIEPTTQEFAKEIIKLIHETQPIYNMLPAAASKRDMLFPPAKEAKNEGPTSAKPVNEEGLKNSRKV